MYIVQSNTHIKQTMKEKRQVKIAIRLLQMYSQIQVKAHKTRKEIQGGGV